MSVDYPFLYSQGRVKKKHPLWNTWSGMRQRCYNQNNCNYPRYGARGITICDRWSEFWNFVEDMGEKPDKNYSIERIDNDKGYAPENCTWASKSVQSSNQSKRKGTTSGHKGVFYHSRPRRWHIYDEKTRKQIGSFKTEQEAVCFKICLEPEVVYND